VGWAERVFVTGMERRSDSESEEMIVIVWPTAEVMFTCKAVGPAAIPPIAHIQGMTKQPFSEEIYTQFSSDRK
jgi:hypothetical protein